VKERLSKYIWLFYEKAIIPISDKHWLSLLGPTQVQKRCFTEGDAKKWKHFTALNIK
jgi:hypothetical protein